jgi:hypothetical protein
MAQRARRAERAARGAARVAQDAERVSRKMTATVPPRSAAMRGVALVLEPTVASVRAPEKDRPGAATA